MTTYKLGRWCAAAVALSLRAAYAAQAPAPAPPLPQTPPVAPVIEAHDSYFGTDLKDNYRWMEGDPSPDLRAFLAASTAYADSQIGRVQGRERLYNDIDKFSLPYVVVSDVTPDGETLFYLKRGPADDVARLTMRGGNSGDERVLVDPETLPDAPPNSEIDQIAPSPDGSYVAYGLADHGPDSSVLRIYDANHNTTLSERIAGARFAATAWLPDSSGFYYTRPVDRGPTNRRFLRLGVFLHHLGTDPEHDRLVLDAAHLKLEFHAPMIVPRIVMPPASDYALAILSDGVSQEVSVYALPQVQVLEESAPWKPLATQGDAVTEVSVSGSIAFLLTHAQSPTGRVVSEDLADPGFATARTVLPPGDSVITGIAAASDALYAARRLGSGMELLRLDYNRADPEPVRLPFAGTIAPAYDGPGGLIADARSDGVFLSLESWMHPKTWLHYDLRVHRVVDPNVVPDFPRDVSAYQAIETTATARDGTKIPLSLIARRDVAHDHARPVLLEAYGSYGYAYDARFLPAAMAWADQGGVYAVAHVRGGGELGLPWRDAGRMSAKSNSITDLLACADALVAQGYTVPAKTAAAATNAGAIAVAGAMLARPDAFRAVLLRAGLLDPLRSEEYPNGMINVAEFGSAHDPVQFPVLLAMDSYQNVKDGTAYPAVLLTGSLNDTHVPAWHAAKMAARLAAASTSARPILLRVSQDAGRQGHVERESLEAEELSFLLWQLDMPDFAQGPPQAAVPAHAKHPRHRVKK
jgi:prolyl oligopeptidase